MRTRSLHLSLLLGAVLACDANTPLEPPLTVDPDDASHAIVDGSHPSGRAGFYFLPPLVPAPVYSGQFDPDLSPEVRIVCTGATGPQCPTLRTLGALVNFRNEWYVADWKPTKLERQVELGPDKYRIEVYVGQELLGHADLWFVEKKPLLKGAAANNIGSDYVGAVAGRRLSIRFRIEKGLPVNTAPVATDDVFQTEEDTPLANNVLSNDSDPDAGDALSAVLLKGPANGALTLNADGSFLYTPNPNFHGSDGFKYRANDGELDSAIGTVTITVNPVDEAPSFRPLAAGGRHTCALNASGAAFCWGMGSVTPTAVSGGHTFVHLAAGHSHTCGLTAAGTAYCWGAGLNGELGSGVAAHSADPVPVSGGHTFVEITAGLFHTCAVDAGGAAWCWGLGPLGHATITLSVTPVAVAGGHEFVRIEAGSAGSQHNCALEVSGAAYCWGDNTFGNLGDGTTDFSFTPIVVAGGHTFTDIGVGAFHTCGVAMGGTGYCWGRNDDGQVGDGTFTHTTSPVAVSGGPTLAEVTGADSHSCALDGSGAAYCWGKNSNGHLGNGTTITSAVPVAVADGHTFLQLSAGSQHTCGRKSSGAIFCWGFSGEGALGNPNVAQSLVPLQTTPFE